MPPASVTPSHATTSFVRVSQTEAPTIPTATRRACCRRLRVSRRSAAQLEFRFPHDVVGHFCIRVLQPFKSSQDVKKAKEQRAAEREKAPIWGQIRWKSFKSNARKISTMRTRKSILD